MSGSDLAHAQPSLSQDLEAAAAQVETLTAPSAEELEIERRVLLRKAGNEDLERALAASTRGADPFQAAAGGTRPGARRPGRPKRDVEDPDAKAFGELFENSRSYIYSVLFVVCTAASPVLIKGSLYSMQTPAVLLFLHMLGTVLTLWIASTYDVFQLNQLTLQGLKGSAVSGTLWALQMLCIFSTLHHNSVIFVLCWSLLGREVLHIVAVSLGSKQPVSGDMKLLLAIGGGAAVLEMILDSDKVWVGFFMMILWTLLTAVEAWWKHLKADPSLGQRITNLKVVGLLRDLSEEEDALTAPNKAFLQHAVPAVPILILGFMALEGRELVNHELSVPAVSIMLLACASHLTAVTCGLLLEGKVEPNTKLMLKAVATGGTIALYFLEEIATISWAAVLCCTVACLASYATDLLRH